MATKKDRKSKLMTWADEAIRKSSIYKDGKIVSESYNGQIAAFSVSVALSGLKPAVALYYNGTSNSGVDKKVVIELLAEMYSKDTGEPKDALFDKVIGANGDVEASLKKKIIEYSIALKLAIRTFKFKSNG